MVHTFFSSDKENERTTERVNVTHSTHRLGPANPNVTDRNLSNKELTASSRKKTLSTTSYTADTYSPSLLPSSP